MPTTDEWTSAGLAWQQRKDAESRRREAEELRAQLSVETDAALLKNREQAVELETQAIRLAWKALQKRCKHPDDEYVPDPSGNSDSYYECRVCRRTT